MGCSLSNTKKHSAPRSALGSAGSEPVPAISAVNALFCRLGAVPDLDPGIGAVNDYLISSLP